jgi:hypothetical protein
MLRIQVLQQKEAGQGPEDSVVADIAHIRAPGAQNILEETQRLAKVSRRNQICRKLLVHLHVAGVRHELDQAAQEKLE